MHLLRRRLKSFAWVALLAMCGVAFGPSISRALESSATGTAAMEAHSVAHSMEMDPQAQMPAEAKSGSEDETDCHGHPSGLLDCCALCAIAASPFTGTDAFIPNWLPLERAAPPTPGHPGAVLALHRRWSSAAPRGPPTVS